MTDLRLRPLVHTALFVALISAGALIAIPIGPVPIVFQNMFVLLAGLILGPKWAVACVGTYLIMGLAGLPVFAGGTSGVGKLFGPTGGYLMGYLPAVALTALIAAPRSIGWFRDLVALIAGTAVIYGCGVTWLKFTFDMPWQGALAAGLFPFLIGDSLKIAAALIIVRKIRPRVRS